MSSTNSLTSTSAHSLDGRLISALELSPETEEKLHRLGIVTLEQLAKLAMNRWGVHERQIIEAIRVELATRLAPHTVWCFTTSGFAAHFVIRADRLFFFKASVIPEDDTSWLCTYQWHAQEECHDAGDTLVLFHKPDVTIESKVSLSEALSDNSPPFLDTHTPNELAEKQNTIPSENDDETGVDYESEDELTNHRPVQNLNTLPTVLVEIINPLNDRERQVIELRYGLQDGNTRTLEAVGTIFGCTRARISQIELKAIKKIRAFALGMRKIREALIILEAALEEANGVLSIQMAAQKLGLVTETDGQGEMVEEARVRFLLIFCKTVDIPKGIPLVALRHHGYEIAFSKLSDACEAVQRILSKAPHPLHIDAVFASLETNTRGQDIVTRIPKATLSACLAALPQVSVDAQGLYYLVGRTFDASQPVIYRPDAKPPIQRIREIRNRTSAGSLKNVTKTKKMIDEQQSEMPWESYDIWNHAIATYVTVGAQRGSTVYLSIDDEVIEQIQRRLQMHEDQPSEAFLKAVKQRIVLRRHVELKRIGGRNRHGEPNGIAFLAAMVLAASRMAEDEEEDIASSNYFTRFCEVLEIDQDGGRPLGMRSGAEAEEPLWREWIVWLGEIGLLSSARPGEGATRYTSYPISQTLLRGTDRDRLRRLFHESNWSESWDVDTLIHAIRRETPYLTKHLRTLLGDRSQRAQAITEAIYEVYEAWGSGNTSGQIGGQARGYNLLADLWRSEDLLSGAIEYSLYPRGPRRQQFDAVVVDIDGQQHSLIAERPGWYMPLCAINEQQLNQGARYSIKQPDELEALVLPRRAFWLLSPDPNNPESGIYASWGTVPLGTPFIILCRRELILDLEKLRTERLIEWSGEPRTSASFPEWVEVTECMVVSPTWDGVEIEHRDLHDALRPKERLNIGLSGGLRAPQGGWLAGLGPQVTIFGFPRDAELRVIRISDNQMILEETRPTNQPFDVVWPTPGDYLIEASAESRTSQCLVKIVDWDALEAASPHNLGWLQIDNVRLCGALLRFGDEEA